jgi:hypothetical protein
MGIVGQSAARQCVPGSLDRRGQLRRVDPLDPFKWTEMTQVVRVLSGQAQVIDHGCHIAQRSRVPVKRRSAGNPPYSCELNTLGWFMPGRIRI